MRPLALALLVVATFGCDRLLGIEDIPRAISDSGTSPDASTFVNTECVACTNAQCKPDRDACLADPRCAGLLGCMAKCRVNDVLCRASCEQTSGGASALPQFVAFDKCSRERCVDQCFGGKGLLKAIDANCACADDACAAEALACVQSGLGAPGIGGCERRVACLAAQPNPDRFVACAENALGGKEYNALLDCARRSPCSTDGKACPFSGGELACVNPKGDGFRYGTSRAPTVDFKFGVSALTLASVTTSQPVAGALVTACSAASCSTCVPVAQGTTGADGSTVLKIPMGIVGSFTGCITVKPSAPDPDAGTASLPEMMVFTGRKIHLNEDVLQTVILERDFMNFYALADGDVPADWVTRGHMIGTVHDCIWLRSVEASVEISEPVDDKTIIRYLESDSVARGAKGTTPFGAFAILNVLPGRHTITVKKAGQVIASEEIEVVAGKLVDANIYPKAKP